MSITDSNPSQLAKRIFSLIDLTTLNNHDQWETIQQLCGKSEYAGQQVAALCVFPEWVFATRQCLQQSQRSMPVATVTNFPEGNDDIDRAVAETQRAVAAGADEIDVVLPYQKLMQGDEETPLQLTAAVKEVCGGQIALKVIIESGELATTELIARASELAIAGGADFIKTSTGKVHTNATVAAAETMLKVISVSDKRCGFKAAGGIRSLSQAKEYIDLATNIMGADWVTADNFRIGASSLLDDLTPLMD